MKGQYWKKSKNLLKAACLSAALVTAWGAGTAPPAAEAATTAYNIYGSMTPTLTTDTMTSVSMLYYLNPSIDASGWRFHTQGLAPLAPIPHLTVNFNFPTVIDIGTFGNYTIAGVFGTSGVTIGMNAADASRANAYPGGPNWIDFFGANNQDSIRAAILDPVINFEVLRSFFDTYGGGTVGTGFGQYQLGSYSPPTYEDPDNPSPIIAPGTLNLNPDLVLVNFGPSGGQQVPLPPTLLLMVPSLGVAFLLRRRKESD
jgi:hypothetical protein